MPQQTSVCNFNRDSFSSKFRFQRPEDLQRVIKGLQFPYSSKIHGYSYTNEEVVMISLTRLSYPNRWEDVAIRFPGSSPSRCQRAFYWFLEFIILNWGYLILNNRDYWVPFMAGSANAIPENYKFFPTTQEDYFFLMQMITEGLLYLVS